jgi:hypothetical protein
MQCRKKKSQNCQLHKDVVVIVYLQSKCSGTKVVEVLVEIGSECGRQHNCPLIVTLPLLLPRGYFHYSRRGKKTRKYLTEQEMQQGNS